MLLVPLQGRADERVGGCVGLCLGRGDCSATGELVSELIGQTVSQLGRWVAGSVTFGE